MNCHNNSNASAGASGAILSVIISAWVVRSLTNVLRLRHPTKLVDLRIDTKRLRTSRASSSGPRLWLSSSRNRRLISALPALTSISRSARRSAPRAAKLAWFRVFFDMGYVSHLFCPMKRPPMPKACPHLSVFDADNVNSIVSDSRKATPPQCFCFLPHSYRIRPIIKVNESSRQGNAQAFQRTKSASVRRALRVTS